MLRRCIKKLQRSLSHLASGSKPNVNGVKYCDYCEEVEAAAATMVPEDVKEGHFVVRAVKDGETKRFVVQLGFLSNPAFLKLLDRAKEEYGFRQKGSLAVPCRPEELQNIIEDRKEKSASARSVIDS